MSIAITKLGGWFRQFGGKDPEAWTKLETKEAAHASALRQGRRTDACDQLGQLLMERDLVDELRLVLFPVVLGDGQRLFGPTSTPKPFRLVETRPLGEGLVYLTYERARGA